MPCKGVSWATTSCIVFLALCATAHPGESGEVGYAIVAVAEGSDIPFTSALLSGFNEEGILIWETPIEANGGVKSGRMFVDQSSGDLVLTLVNTTQQPSQVTLSLRNTNGQLIEEADIQLLASQQQTSRLTELLPGAPQGFVGTCSFESDEPLAFSALDEEINAYGELIYVTVPLVSLDPADDTRGAAIAQIATGKVDAMTQMTARLVMLNPHQMTLRGRLQIVSADGNRAPAQVAETIRTEFFYEIPPDGVLTYELTTTDSLSSAYAAFGPEAGSTPPAAYAVLGLEREGQTLSKTLVPVPRWTRHARIFVGFQQALVGLAIGNPNNVAQEVILEAGADSGKPIETVSVIFEPGERLVKVVSELFPGIDRDQITTIDVRSEEPFFLGSLKVTFNERSDLFLTGLPFADLERPLEGSSALLAQLGTGDEGRRAVERQFLFLTPEGKGSRGQIDFFQPDGEKLFLPMGGGMADHYCFWMSADNPFQLATNPIGPPKITEVSPSKVSLRGGETVTITGRNFTEDSTVVVAKTVIQNVQFIDSTRLMITTLPTDVGRSNLTVQTGYGLAQSPILVDSGFSTDLQPGEITTVAGGSTYAGDGGPSTAAWLASPTDLHIDRWGNLYFSEWYADRIRRVDLATGIITTVAGFGRFGIGGEGGPAVAAGLHNPSGVVSDADGNLFIAESRSNRIRRVDSMTGQITTIAGSLESGFAGDGGPALAALLNHPEAIGLDSAGNLYIADAWNERVRTIDAATGLISTIAGNGERCPWCRDCSTCPPGACSPCPPEGFFCEPCEIGEGGPATEAVIGSPGALLPDGSGNLVIVAAAPSTVPHEGSVAIRAVDLATGIITTLAGGGDQPISDQSGQQAREVRLESISDLASDSLGNLYFAHHERNYVGSERQSKTRFLKLEAASGELSQFVGLDQGGGLAIHRDRWLYYTAAGFIYRLDLATGTNVVWAGGGESVGDADLAIAARTSWPEVLKTDSQDNLYYAKGSKEIRRFQVDGIMEIVLQTEEPCRLTDFVADSGQLFVSEICSENGTEYPRIRRTGMFQDTSDVLYRGLPEGGFDWPGGYGLTMGQASELYFSSRDLGTIHKIDLKNGQIEWVAGAGGEDCWFQDGSVGLPLCNPEQLTSDDNGSLYVIEENRIRKIDLAEQTITTLAGDGQWGSTGDGGPALNTSIRPNALAVDARGNVFFSDWSSHRVYRVDPLTGIIEVYAGSGGCLNRGDGGPATKTGICRPQGLAVDRAGNLFVADGIKSMIRAIKANNN